MPINPHPSAPGRPPTGACQLSRPPRAVPGVAFEPFELFEHRRTFPLSTLITDPAMNTRQNGFTMIELIVVIIILGVLSAVALPKFVDMRSNAEQASADGIAGAAAAAMNLNFSGCALTNNVPTANKCIAVSTCAGVGAILQGGLDSRYTADVNAVGVDLGATNGNTATCKVTKTVGSTTYASTFTGVSAGN
jgi:MSHA pilin protein MshA